MVWATSINDFSAPKKIEKMHQKVTARREQLFGAILEA